MFSVYKIQTDFDSNIINILYDKQLNMHVAFPLAAVFCLFRKAYLFT